MSRRVKRKHVFRENHLDNYSLPVGNQQIVKVISTKGNNLHEVETSDGTKFLASMPNKFRRTFWIKRKNFVLVEPIKEGSKVKAEIIRILSKEHVQYYKQANIWPEEFVIEEETEEESIKDTDFFVNPNRDYKSHSESDSGSYNSLGNSSNGEENDGSELIEDNHENNLTNNQTMGLKSKS